MQNLSSNLITRILLFLDIPSLVRSGRVCKKWRKIVTANCIWEHKCFTAFPQLSLGVYPLDQDWMEFFLLKNPCIKIDERIRKELKGKKTKPVDVNRYKRIENLIKLYKVGNLRYAQTEYEVLLPKLHPFMNSHNHLDDQEEVMNVIKKTFFYKPKD